MPPLLLQPRSTRFSSSSHLYSVQLYNARVNQYSQSFIPFSGKLWNSLTASIFPSSCDLTSFKRFQDICPRFLANSFLILKGTDIQVGLFSNLLLPLANSLSCIKKKKYTSSCTSESCFETTLEYLSKLRRKPILLTSVTMFLHCLFF
ncbi:hypothetical protein E2C01_031744 [Portunus trituberculatus]|uniref:Uncharacterized protein n=1 Tax=Portunus trituberculatus TaxID=210409 RepID=A0A5B7EYH1_PORTR|nr:hypothetical protein [Portunus trituberculatus]